MANRPGHGQRVNAAPKTLGDKVRASIKAQLATIAHEREQARSMIEQGQQMMQNGQAGLHQMNGAEIALKKQLEDLDAAEKSDAQ